MADVTKIMADHQTWLATGGASGARADLSGEDLRGVTFPAGASFCGVNFERANLSRQTLAGADFGPANGVVAELNGATFTRATLSGATFAQAHLNDVRFDKATLDGADFSGATLANAVFRRASLMTTKFLKADLTGANLYRGQLTLTQFAGARMANANLRRAELLGNDLSGVVFTNANLSYANLREAELKGAKLTEADLTGADLRGVKNALFDTTRIQGAHLSFYCTDPWSELRRTYTGARFVLNLILLAIFFLPYLLQSIFWVGVSEAQAKAPHLSLIAWRTQTRQFIVKWEGRIQEKLKSARHEVREEAAAAQKVLGDAVQLLDDESWQYEMDADAWQRHAADVVVPKLQVILERLAELVDRLEGAADEQLRAAAKELKLWAAKSERFVKSWKQHRVWWLVLGGHRGWFYFAVAALMLVYNALRALVTWFVAPMRDEEERAGYTPSYQGRRQKGTGWRKWLARLRSWFSGYRWLSWLHWYVALLWYFSLLSLPAFLYQLYLWFCAPVWLP